MEDRDDYNWNSDPDETELVLYYLTDFCVKDSVGELCSPLLCGCEDHIFLEGVLISMKDPSVKKQHQVLVENHFINIGLTDPTQDTDKGFWLHGRNPDVRYKLVFPASADYSSFVPHILSLTNGVEGLNCCSYPYDSSSAFHMTNFSITDRSLGTFQTPILPNFSKNPFTLRGSIQIRDADLAAKAGFPPDLTEVNIETYVQSTYAVDFGPEATLALPRICVRDCLGNWIVLRAPCHPDYEMDYQNTWHRTVGNLSAYNWPSEADDDVWRHLTNYRLTDATGALCGLEIGDENGVFILWGELAPPPRATCPPIAVKLYVTTHSIDVGRHLHDPEKGVWMEDVRGDWYKLVEPSAEYRRTAEPFLAKAADYLRFHDALVFQEQCATLSVFSPQSAKYSCNLPVIAVNQRANPPFDLYFVQENKAFVKLHLSADFDVNGSAMLFFSIDNLTGQKGIAPTEVAAARADEAMVKSSSHTSSMGSDDDSDGNDSFKMPTKKKRAVPVPVKEPKKRGRPPKNKPEAPHAISKKAPTVEILSSDDDEEEKRGRASKKAAAMKPPDKPVPPPEVPAPAPQISSQRSLPAEATHKRTQGEARAVPATAFPAPAPKPKKSRFSEANDDFPVFVSARRDGDAPSQPPNLPANVPPPPLPPTTAKYTPSLSQSGNFAGALSAYQNKTVLPPPPPPHPRPQQPLQHPPSGNGMGRWNDYGRDMQLDGDANAQRSSYAYRDEAKDFQPPPLPYGVPPPPPPPQAQTYQPPVHIQIQVQAQALPQSQASRGRSRSRSPPRAMPPPSVPPTHAPSMPNGGESRDPRLNRNLQRSRFDTSDPEVPFAGRIEPPGSNQNQGPVDHYPATSTAEVGSGGGRGRNATLPAWMTAQPNNQAPASDSNRQGLSEQPYQNRQSDRREHDNRQFEDASFASYPPRASAPPVVPAPVARDFSRDSQNNGDLSARPAGRGRAATHPAWMTSNQQNVNVSAQSSAPPPAHSSSNLDSRSQYSDARQEDWDFFGAGRDGRGGGGGGYPGGGNDASRDGGFRRADAPSQSLPAQQPRWERGRDQEEQRSRSRSRSRERGSGAAGTSGGRGDNGRFWHHDSRSRDGAAGGGPAPPLAGERSNREPDGRDWERRDSSRQEDRQREDPGRDGSRFAHDGSFNQIVDRLRQQVNGQAHNQGQPQYQANPYSASASTQQQNSGPATKGPCTFCRGRKKLKDCPVEDHIAGMLVTPPAQPSAPPASAPPPQAPNYRLPPPPRHLTVDTRHDPTPCINGCGTPELDQNIGIDSKAANEDAAEALLSLVEGCSGGGGNNDGGGGNSETPSTGATSSGTVATPLAAATVAKGDDISVERARYLQSKQQHGSGGAATTKSAASAGPALSTTAAIVANKPGKWGRLVTSPRSNAASSLGLVKLGERQNDPKKRLEQTTRNSLGAFATPHSGTAAQAVIGERHSPPSRLVRPAKSALRRVAGPVGDNDTAASEEGSSGNSTSAVAHLKWQDMTGKALFTRHVYENEFELEV